ncbi:ABC transporter permease [bacterium]|nr:ABC transporter permease [bacterium]
MIQNAPLSRSYTRMLMRRLAPFMGLIVIFIAGIALNGNTFINMYNQLNVLGRVSIKALPAVGMTLVIISAGIDLSVGSMVSLSSVVCAMLLMERTWTKATSLSLPLFALMGLVLGYVGVSRLAPRVGIRGTSSAAAGWTGGIAAAAVLFVWGYSQVPSGFSTVAVLLIVPGVGAALGALNGLIISKGKIQPFIVTLGMMSAAVGLSKYIAGKGGQIHTIYYDAAGYSAAGTAHIAPKSFDILNSTIPLMGMRIFPVTGVFFLVSVLVMYFILTRLRLGRYIYAIGGNEETSRLSGINVDRVKIVTYAVSGCLAAFAGVLYCSAYTQGKADAGITWELDAIAAVVIGGTSLMGGKGSVIGTMVGVLILGYLSNILNLQEVSSEVQDILKGVIIVGAVLLQEGIIARWLRVLRKRL